MQRHLAVVYVNYLSRETSYYFVEEKSDDMSGILNIPVKKRRLQYDRSNLPRAYAATQNGMSVCKAAKMYKVPESTLRDRTRGNVDVDARNGTGTLLSREEEEKLVGHVKYMADIGYGYNKSSIQYMAKDYAESLGKSVQAADSLSNCWFYGFMGRWPELKIVKPQKLAIARAKSASREVLSRYYQELGTIITNNNLGDKPGRIYNVDETGISTEHTPPKIVCDRSTNPQSVTSPRGSTVTVIAAGNAIGNNIPPYYVFPGVRWNDSLLSGASAGAAGTMSKSGWSSSEVFQSYLTKHFALHANIKGGADTEPTLVLYDGHRSHISLTLTDWAKSHNVILFVLPPHTSHLTQPLDVGVFGPFKAMYNKECQTYMKNNPGLTITKYQVAELTARPYLKSLTPENLTAAFRKTGIYPLNSNVISDSQVAPAVIYPNQQTEQSDEVASTTQPPEKLPTQDQHENSQSTEDQNPPKTTHQNTQDSFFSQRTITNVVQNRTKRKFIPPLLTGNLLKKSVTSVLNKQASKKTSVAAKSKGSKPDKVSIKKKSEKVTVQSQTGMSSTSEPVPSTSGLNKKGGPIDLASYEDSSDSISDTEEEKCCACNRFQPEEVRTCHSVIFVKWAKCDFCTHWTHLQFCSDVRVIRRGSEFRCPHCLSPAQ